MKEVQVVYYLEDNMVEGGVYRSVEHAYLLTPDIAVSPCLGRIIFMYVAPAAEPGFYINTGDITEIDVPEDVPDRIASLPPAETLTFALWVAGITPDQTDKSELLAGLNAYKAAV